MPDEVRVPDQLCGCKVLGRAAGLVDIVRKGEHLHRPTHKIRMSLKPFKRSGECCHAGKTTRPYEDFLPLVEIFYGRNLTLAKRKIWARGTHGLEICWCAGGL